MSKVDSKFFLKVTKQFLVKKKEYVYVYIHTKMYSKIKLGGYTSKYVVGLQAI